MKDYIQINQRFGLNRSEFMITFSHNHPVLSQDDIVDYYPSDDAQRRWEYSEWMEEKIGSH